MLQAQTDKITELLGSGYTVHPQHVSKYNDQSYIDWGPLGMVAPDTSVVTVMEDGTVVSGLFDDRAREVKS